MYKVVLKLDTTTVKEWILAKDEKEAVKKLAHDLRIYKVINIIKV